MTTEKEVDEFFDDIVDPILALKRKASRGDRDAMYRLYEYYQHGLMGLKRDKKQAHYWFKKLCQVT